jgi:HSP20 family molecular chaperone IbpA
MSNTTAKNLLLSQAKLGQFETVPVTAPTYTTVTSETSTTIKVEVPGIDPANIDVSCSDNKLFISCERGDLAFPLDATTDFSKVSADIQWGMLTVEIPAPPSPETRSIRVNIHDAPATKPAPKAKFTKDEEG